MPTSRTNPRKLLHLPWTPSEDIAGSVGTVIADNLEPAHQPGGLGAGLGPLEGSLFAAVDGKQSPFLVNALQLR